MADRERGVVTQFPRPVPSDRAGLFLRPGVYRGLRAELGAAPVTVTTAVPGLMRTGSHLHALFRGQREREFTWFSLGARRIFDPVTALGRSAARRLNEIPDEPESAETGHRS